MLTLTQDAADVIRGIVEANEELPDESGLRITAESTDTTGPQLNLSIVPGPAEGDAAVDAEGAHVYLGPQAAEVLDDKVLHAEVEGNEVRFMLGEQE